jgi:hypothetical protein
MFGTWLIITNAAAAARPKITQKAMQRFRCHLPCGFLSKIRIREYSSHAIGIISAGRRLVRMSVVMFIDPHLPWVP